MKAFVVSLEDSEYFVFAQSLSELETKLKENGVELKFIDNIKVLAFFKENIII